MDPNEVQTFSTETRLMVMENVVALILSLAVPAALLATYAQKVGGEEGEMMRALFERARQLATRG